MKYPETEVALSVAHISWEQKSFHYVSLHLENFRILDCRHIVLIGQLQGLLFLVTPFFILRFFLYFSLLVWSSLMTNVTFFTLSLSLNPLLIFLILLKPVPDFLLEKSTEILTQTSPCALSLF